MSEQLDWSDLEYEDIHHAFEAEDEHGNPCLILTFFGMTDPVKITSDADISGGGVWSQVIVPKMPTIEYVKDMSKIKRKGKGKGKE